MTTSMKRRRRRARQAIAAVMISLPQLEPVPKRQPNGQKRRSADDAQIETLRTRARREGVDQTPENLRDMRAPWWGCNAGRAMASQVADHDDRLALWDAIQHMRAVIVAYDAAIGAPMRHATCLRILAPAECLHADASSPPPDDRDEPTRQRQAVSALMRVETWLGHTDSAAAGAAKRAVWDDAEVYDAPGMVRALRCVSDGLTGRAMRYRAGA